MSKPLAWINAITGDVTTVDCSDTILWAPLYLAPSTKRKPLSDEEILELWDKTINTKTIVKGKDMTLWDYILMFTRTIEQHGITGADNE
jgi:hypothetical protein